MNTVKQNNAKDEVGRFWATILAQGTGIIVYFITRCSLKNDYLLPIGRKVIFAVQLIIILGTILILMIKRFDWIKCFIKNVFVKGVWRSFVKKENAVYLSYPPLSSSTLNSLINSLAYLNMLSIITLIIGTGVIKSPFFLLYTILPTIALILELPVPPLRNFTIFSIALFGIITWKKDLITSLSENLLFNYNFFNTHHYTAILHILTGYSLVIICAEILLKAVREPAN